MNLGNWQLARSYMHVAEQGRPYIHVVRGVLTVVSYPCREKKSGSLCFVYFDQVIGAWFTTYERVQVGTPGYTIFK